MGYQQTKDALEKSLKKTWYRLSGHLSDPLGQDRRLTVRTGKELDLETWRAMEELQKEGKIQGLGLSNFPSAPYGRTFWRMEL